MKFRELIDKAAAEGIIISRYHIDDWLAVASTRQEQRNWLVHRELPNNISFNEILNASKVFLS
jgi:hypothetical protein